LIAGTHICCLVHREARTPYCNTPSLHDALPISSTCSPSSARSACIRSWMAPRPTSSTRPRPTTDWLVTTTTPRPSRRRAESPRRSEEHTSELQSRENLVCRLLLEKKKTYESACS